MHLGLIGYGAIAQSLIGLLPDGPIPSITVLVRPTAKEAKQNPSNSPINFVTSLAELLATSPTVIVECASHSAVKTYASDILKSGTPLIIASVGAFSDTALYDAIKLAAIQGNAILRLPTGGIGGLDLLSVLSNSGKVDVTYRGIKPPAAWKGSPAEAVVNLDKITTRTAFFKGNGRAAAANYPKNANVVAALALAGAGFDKMQVELIADPDVTINTHSFVVKSPHCSYEITIENRATKGNPRTSMTTVLSLLSEINAIAAQSQTSKG